MSVILILLILVVAVGVVLAKVISYFINRSKKTHEAYRDQISPDTIEAEKSALARLNEFSDDLKDRSKDLFGRFFKTNTDDTYQYIDEALRTAKSAQRAVYKEERAAEKAEHREKRDAYLDSLKHVTFFQILIIFTVSSIGGLIIETFWVRFDMGIWQSRYGMVWGPFSPLYGLGSIFLTLILWKIRKQPAWIIFLCSMAIGTLLEQLTGMLIDGLMNATSWSYASYPDAITEYVSVRMSIIWGLLGTVWCCYLMPEIIYRIGDTPNKPVYTLFIVLFTIYLTLDGVTTIAVGMRKAARDAGIPPQNIVDEYFDYRYNDEFMENRFQNLQYEASSEE
ncbi:MAG: putative ABC transporter permease [Coriobacteriales bacterium]|nr:putative ABC transporter permease [Coriobacteriales bacterium]